MAEQDYNKGRTRIYKISPILDQRLKKENIDANLAVGSGQACGKKQLDIEGLALLLIEREGNITGELNCVMPIGEIDLDHSSFYLVTKKEMKKEARRIGEIRVIKAREFPLFGIYHISKEEFLGEYNGDIPAIREASLMKRYDGRVVLLWAHNLKPIANIIPSCIEDMDELKAKARSNPDYKPDTIGIGNDPTEMMVSVDFSNGEWEKRLRDGTKVIMSGEHNDDVGIM